MSFPTDPRTSLPTKGESPRRWDVPRPGRDGKPLGVLRINVVPAESYDRLKAECDRYRAALEQIADAETAEDADAYDWAVRSHEIALAALTYDKDRSGMKADTETRHNAPEQTGEPNA